MKRLKVSREGVLLIKSFEGFRPRAVRQGDGWLIGYGHTLSAREGASVTEADAELLLHWDLISVANSINDHISNSLNQHQFDALASFAFSVGMDRFNASDVLASLNAGSTAEAADAMASWPDPASLSAPMRRRAERALFVSDPDEAFTLSELLKAPLSPLPPLPPLPPAIVTKAESSLPAPVLADVPASDTPVSGMDTAIPTDSGTNVPVETDGMTPFSSTDETISRTEPIDRHEGSADDIAGPLEENAVISAAATDVSGGLVVVPLSTAEPTPDNVAEDAPFVLTPDATDASPKDLRAGKPDAADGPLLFEENVALSMDHSPTLRRTSATGPFRFDLRRTGSYLIMSVFGLTTFGVSIVSFRKACLYQSSNQFLIMGGMLAVLGLACVIVSAWNLYREIDDAQN